MKILLSCLLAASASVCAAQATVVTPTAPKQSREDYLATKVPEAREICKRVIVATAKDPDSVRFLGPETVFIGRRLTRNHIIFTFEAMGRNTYGAVLRHTMTCNIKCTEKDGCQNNPIISE